MAKLQKVTVELPATLAQELADAEPALLVDLLERGLRERRIEQALQRYQQGGMSFAAAAELAGVGQADLARFAYTRGIEPPVSDELLREELG